MKKVLLILFIFLGSLILIIYGYLLKISPSETATITDSNGKEIVNSIASLEKIELGGIDQWLLIRGKNIDKPILLILHGGPGSPELPMVRYFNEDLEDHFVVVNWDQRGAGKSYSADIPSHLLTIDHFVSDVHELTSHLKSRFNKEKIYLLGHSWGTVIGTLAAQKFPEDYYAYLGMGQVVNMEQGELISYQYTLNKAKFLYNEKAIHELQNIGFPPYEGDKTFNNIMIQRNWLLKFGGSLYGETSYDKLIKTLLFCQEYSLTDKINYLIGSKKSVKILWPDLMKVDFFTQVPRLDLPVYLFQGRDDFQVPSELAEKYLEELEAPDKQLIWFEKSGHGPMFEENGKFLEIMVNKVLKETFEPSTVSAFNN
ncbi:alpha/beta hydrolase [soil metagenome]